MELRDYTVEFSTLLPVIYTSSCHEYEFRLIEQMIALGWEITTRYDYSRPLEICFAMAAEQYGYTIRWDEEEDMSPFFYVDPLGQTVLLYDFFLDLD